MARRPRFSHRISYPFYTSTERLLDLLPATERDYWACACIAVNADMRNGVVASTHATRNRYWRHWCEFLPASVDQYLQTVEPAEGLVLIQIFARRVRKGLCGRGQQVQAGSVQTAIGAVGKTIELAGYMNPLHRPGTTNYHAALKMQIEGYKREDPATQKQRAVPVSIPNLVFLATRTTPDRRARAIGELVLIAFYFLLRVGEYTHATGQRRTQIFRLQDVKLFADRKEITAQMVHQWCERIDTVSLTIDNQKNGCRGETISHHALKDKTNPCCPVKALVARVRDLVSDKAKPETLLCAFRETPAGSWRFIRSKDIVDAVKKAIPLAGDDTSGFSEADVGSHSLRAGGATAMYINGQDAMKIQRAGRWTSNTFMTYIHSQLDVVSQGLSESMSKATPYLNMGK